MSRIRKPKVKAFLCVIILILNTLVFSGCWGKRELEERAFVTMLGIDKGDTQPILLTAVVPIPRTIFGGGGLGSGGDTSTIVLSATGTNINSALANVERMSSRDLTTSQMSYLILGEEFAKDDVGHVVDVFARSLEFRHNTLVAVCRGRAYDFLMNFSYLEEAEPAVYLAGLIDRTFRTLGYVPIVTMHQFMLAYNTLQSEPWTPFITLASGDAAPTVEESEKNNESSGNGQGSEAGSNPKTTPSPVVDVVGSAVFRKVGKRMQMVGTLDVFETMAALILRGELRSGELEVTAPSGNEVSTIIFRHTSRHVDLDISPESIHVTYSVKLTGSLEENPPTEADIPEIEFLELRPLLIEVVGEQMQGLLIRTTQKLQQLNSDVLNLGHLAQTKFLTYPEWQSYDWSSKFRSVKFSFDVDVQLLSSGFVFQRPSPE
jgi:spore germination protein KC